MKRNHGLAALCLATAILLGVTTAAAGRSDCIEGSGAARQEKRTLAPFTALDINGVFEVRVTCGAPQEVTLSGDDNILAHIRTEVRDGILTVDSKRSICIKTDLRIDIQVPNIEGVTADGTVNLHAEKIEGPDFALTLNGSSNASLQGECRRFKADLLGVAGLKAEALKARHVSIRVAGVGEAAVYASERLDAAISGTGTVAYAGNPGRINPEITGLGELIPR